MGFFGKDNLTEAESGNWNSAKEYAEKKIMNPLEMVDVYEEIAWFGTSDIISDLIMQNRGNVGLDELKFKSFQRLIHKLILICNNSDFALQTHSGSKTKLNSLRRELENIRDNLGKYAYIITDQTRGTKNLKLKPEYMNVLKRVSEIKKELNTPLNEGDLIFIHKETFDPKAFKKRIIDDAVTKG